jgi:hypothetical protein
MLKCCKPLQRSASRVARATTLLLALIACAPYARAEVRIQGDVTAVQVIANQAQVSEVLNALGKRFNVRYDALSSLDGVINGKYSGPLEQVLLRVLIGFNYVIKTREGAIEVIVVGRPGDTPVAVPAAAPAPAANTNPAAQWRSSIPATPKP